MISSFITSIICSRKKETELDTRKRMKKYDFSYGNHLANLHRIDCISQDEEEEEKKRGERERNG